MLSAATGAILAAVTERNVLGGELEPCGTDPLTGFYRDGCCNTGPDDDGMHTICCQVTAESLAHQKFIGNDLTISFAAEAGQLQLNAFEPIMGWSLYKSIKHLASACLTLKAHCVDGIEANEGLLSRRVRESITLVTALNPIIGYEAYVAPGKRTEREARRRGEAGYHLTLLAKNAVGFRNLIKLSSLAFLEGYYYIPRIDKELLEQYHEGIICLSGCASAEFSEHILAERMKEAEELAVWFHKVFSNDFYIEIQNNGLEIQRLCAEGAIDIANRDAGMDPRTDHRHQS